VNENTYENQLKNLLPSQIVRYHAVVAETVLRAFEVRESIGTIREVKKIGGLWVVWVQECVPSNSRGVGTWGWIPPWAIRLVE